MLFPRFPLAATAAAAAAVSLLATATVSDAAAVSPPSAAERIVHRFSAQEKQEKIRRFEKQIRDTAEQVASKYPVDYINNVSDYSLFEQFQDTGKLPEPIRGETGSNITNVTDTAIDRQNPDTFAPPNSDAGSVYQAKWPMSLSHNRLQNGGWARQQNVDVLPQATALAGVQMHLDQWATRELHWHTAGEWAYVLEGTFRVGIVDNEGRNYINNVGKGDLWFFPSGFPHTIEAISEGGGEFLLVFNDGSFSEDDTFLLSDFVAHVPREILNKNFPGMNNSDFNKFPSEELYIFPTDDHTSSSETVASPQGDTPNPYTYNASQYPAKQLPGGSVKIVDSKNFTNTEISMAEVTINPGAMRELHWHPNSDEWSFFLSGRARVTVWIGENNARTYDYEAGDVLYVTESSGHYIEALGDEPVHYLELFAAATYQDVSLSTWLALTPPSVVKSHLGWSDSAMKVLENFATNDHQVVQGNNDGSGKPISKRSISDMYGGKQMWA